MFLSVLFLREKLFCTRDWSEIMMRTLSNMLIYNLCPSNIIQGGQTELIWQISLFIDQYDNISSLFRSHCQELTIELILTHLQRLDFLWTNHVNKCSQTWSECKIFFPSAVVRSNKNANLRYSPGYMYYYPPKSKSDNCASIWKLVKERRLAACVGSTIPWHAAIFHVGWGSHCPQLPSGFTYKCTN